jgi:hypothetical protein
MLENHVGGPDQQRLEYEGRVQYPERLHVIARVIDITTQLLATIETFSNQTDTEVNTWPSTTDPGLTASTRRLLEDIRGRYRNR